MLCEAAPHVYLPSFHSTQSPNLDKHTQLSVTTRSIANTCHASGPEQSLYLRLQLHELESIRLLVYLPQAPQRASLLSIPVMSSDVAGELLYQSQFMGVEQTEESTLLA